MSGRPLRPALVDYLAVRRSLGFKLARDGLLLEQFVAFCEQRGAGRVTGELALAWVTSPTNRSGATFHQLAVDSTIPRVAVRVD